MYGQYDNIRMAGITASVPKHVINNENLIPIYGEKVVKKQIKATGIVERHCAMDGQNTLDLCYFAANRLLDALKWSREEVRLVIFVSAHPVFAAPANAFYLQRRLGIGTNCIAFDINLACSGFVVGMETIGAFLQSYPEGTKALLMVGATPNAGLDEEDQGTAPLFGDGCGAAAFEVKKGHHMYFSQYSDGNQMEYLYRRPGEAPHMNGMGLFNFAIKEVSDSINEFFKHYEISRDEVDCFFLHQAQKFMFDKVMEFCDLPEDKCPITYDHFGNTASASIPITMSYYHGAIDYKKRVKLFLCAFGGGLSWGNVLLDTEDILVLPVEYTDERLEMEECLC